MTIPAKITLLTFGVSDVERSTKFYESLGWKKSDKSVEGTTFIQLGSIVLSLYTYEKLAEDALVEAGERQTFPGFTVAINCGSRDEVNTVMAQAKSVGAKINKEAQEVFWGGYSGYFSDPDGYLWEIAHNPFFDFDDQGYLSI